MKLVIRLIISIFFLFQFSTPVFCAEIPTAPAEKTNKLLPSAFPVPETSASSPKIRVLIQKEVERFQLEIPFPYRIQIAPHLQVIEENTALANTPVTVSAKGIQIGATLYNATHIKFVTQRGYFRVNGNEYAEDLHIILSDNQKINLVNEIGLENYLKGVLPWEMSEKWPLEALKAQAVAARTFAYFKMLERGDQAHVLTADVLGQVYKGKAPSKKSRTNEAVDSTRGEVLIFKGKFFENIFPTFFHANCGGMTTAAEYVWRITPNPVLKGVSCSFCKTAKYHEWQSQIKLSEMETKIKAEGYTISPISEITFSETDPSGRTRKVAVTHAKGKLLLDSNAFRILIGPEILRSTRASVYLKDGVAYFKGFGWGHGAGLCQWGARGQAESGKNYVSILQYYYPGSSLKRLYGSSSLKASKAKVDELFDKADRFLNEWFG